jgi:CHAT domain-containing protein/tetratricopeptide (TPR) repeat protein
MVGIGVLLLAPWISLHQPVERTLAPSEVHSYQVKLGAGQYARILIDSDTATVSARLRQPGGGLLFEATGERGETLPLSWKSASEGLYQVELRLPQRSTIADRYRISLNALRNALPDDDQRIAAERSFLDATGDTREGTAQSLRRAVDRFKASIRIWQKLSDRLMLARALVNLAEAHYYLDERQQALQDYLQALPLWQSEADPKHEAITLSSLGVVYTRLGERDMAVDAYNRALPLRRAAGDRKGEATTLHNIGFTYYSFGDVTEAVPFLEKALPLRREVHDVSGEATTLNILGQLYAVSEPQKAVECLQQAVRLRRTVSDHLGEASTLQNLGVVYQGSGDPEQALHYYLQALEILRVLGSKLGTADALNNIGRAYLSQGQPAKALRYLKDALAIRRAGEDRAAEANSWDSIGRARLMSGAAAQALDPLDHALLLAQQAHDLGQETNVLLDLGLAHNAVGDPMRAREYLQRALEGFESLGHVSDLVRTLEALARADRALGDWSQARNDSERAVRLIESLRGGIADQNLQLSYFASVRQVYELLIRSEIDAHRPVEAFEASESARARSLLDLLSAAHADIRAGADPVLLTRERSLLATLNAKSERQIRLMAGSDGPQKAKLAGEITSVTKELDRVEAEIRSHSPRYAALIKPQPLTLAEIQRQVLDPNTLLLEYALGADGSYLWAVTRDSVEAFELPKRAAIEDLARRVYQEFSISDPREGNGPSRAAAALSRMLLAPVADRLGSNRLVVVADGALQYVPFAPLPSPSKQRPLILDHDITYLPSASALAVLRSELTDRRPAPKLAAILADPVFDPNDPRVTGGRGGSLLPSSDVERSARESGLLTFERLGSTRLEADELAMLAGPGQYLRAVDFSASRATALNPELGNYRIVHLASHGLLNPAHPEMSGIVLSLVDSHGRPQNGFLRTGDIFNMKLTADLVTLSACQTALGKDVKGEGLVGLTRGFMYAGAARVLASLWRIPDRATAELMRRFYRAMVVDALAPSAALRKAQVEMLQDNRWAPPYNWAAFVLQGEWR